MIFCKNCRHWVDEPLDDIASDPEAHSHLFMGCRLLGPVEFPEKARRCARYEESAELFALCRRCGLAVPKVCLSLGECTNCTDTDLFCSESCLGGENRKYCTHFVRLHAEGIKLIDDKNQVFDLFPALDLPGKKKTP